MARTFEPRQGETLAAYLERLLSGRWSVNGLARELAAKDGRSKETWERSLRRWMAGATATLSEENAATLADALDAGFTQFVRGLNGESTVRDLLTQALERIELVEARLAVLERAPGDP